MTYTKEQALKLVSILLSDSEGIGEDSYEALLEFMAVYELDRGTTNIRADVDATDGRFYITDRSEFYVPASDTSNLED